MENFGNRPRRRNKVYDLFLATWNVLSLYRSGALNQLKSEDKPEGRRRVGRQRLRWLDGVLEDLRELKVEVVTEGFE